ncbi:uncharacterized protein K460DRAFT_402633 [Cucurbitaria berberidis CBS 394.84]|uniref:Uncharacterized protein n=1 Tax=Cucurbitaria berberidis CBS 394.84 TaxID=1168544 RepID=A0A9P4GLA1_9PLEO|nr:uncharacterized protein K460DRAFT_402633 [Cucurbitaria berberidis CBS 394.84]KAF1847269.1 hypothetical protein K460DRAFT_402633 [Cucurbitaria berberidis CBS 394.84]
MQTPSPSTSSPSSPDRCSSEGSTKFTTSPPCGNHNVDPINHPRALGKLLSPPKSEVKVCASSPVNDNQTWDISDPTTWPILHLPFHMKPGCSAPTYIDELLVHVYYMGAGARLLRELLFRAIEEVEREEDKVAIERTAFLCWPFNVTANGYWKDKGGMTKEDLDAWRTMKARNNFRFCTLE